MNYQKKIMFFINGFGGTNLYVLSIKYSCIFILSNDTQKVQHNLIPVFKTSSQSLLAKTQKRKWIIQFPLTSTNSGTAHNVCCLLTSKLSLQSFIYIRCLSYDNISYFWGWNKNWVLKSKYYGYKNYWRKIHVIIWQWLYGLHLSRSRQFDRRTHWL